LTTFPLADRQAEPGGITAGPDGAMWFTERRGNRIGRITTDGAVSDYVLRLRRADNNPFWIELTARADRARNGALRVEALMTPRAMRERSTASVTWPVATSS
jgi:streptogramin lyase